MKILLVLSIFVFVSIFYFSDVNAQESQISVQTNDPHYNEGEVIVISGHVNTIILDAPVVIQIIYEGTYVHLEQIQVTRDGSFTTTIIAEGALWKESGEYLVRASQGYNIAETEFSYTPKLRSIETSSNFVVDAGRYGTFDVEYTIRGGTVENMVLDSDIFAIIVQIDATDEGTITLDLPREFIGAEKQDGKDDTFIILIDGIEVAYREPLAHQNSRGITINFGEDDSNIEIIGTYTKSAQRHGMSITATADRGSETITVTGKTVSNIVDVSFRVVSPSGNSVVAVGQVSPNSHGEFIITLTVGPVWDENGFYEIEVMQSVHANSLYTLHVLVEVNYGLTERTFVTVSTLDREINVPKVPNRDAGIVLSVNAERGSTGIEIMGFTDRVSQDITLTVNAPNGNIVSINRIAPMINGEFTFEITTGGLLWRQDGSYTVTAQQYDNPKYTVSTEVNIKNGVVMPLPDACVGCSIEDAREAANEELEEFTISVWTDKTHYNHNDMIQVEGKVSHVSGFPVTITVLSPENSLVLLDQLTVANDGSFETTLNIVGTMWEYRGTYIIKVNYGTAEKSNTAEVRLTGGVAYPPEPDSLCGPGTHYDEPTNSCKLNHIDPPIDRSLQQENTQLKIENQQLKNQINKMQLEIDNLQKIIHEQIQVIFDVLVD